MTLFDLPSVRLGRIFGIPLEVNVSWLPIFVLVTWSLASQFPEMMPGVPITAVWVVSALTALAFFGSVVMHEVAHSLVARSGGLHISKVTLFMFGGVSQMESEPGSPGLEAIMAVAGPAASLVLGMGLYAASLIAAGAGASPLVVEPLAYLSTVNFVVGVFNLLPGFPMDGGRVLRAAFWRATGDLLKSTRWASRIGQGLGYLLMAVGLAGGFVGYVTLLWLLLLGWFLVGLASSAYQQQVTRSRLEHVRVGDVMSAPVVVVPGDMDLEAIIDEFFLGQRHSRYPIVIDGRIAGLISLAGVKAVPRAAWRDTSALDVSDRDVDRLVVSAETPIDAVVDRLTSGSGAVLVVSDGRLAGIVTKADVMVALKGSASASRGDAG
jgi:Zn-dependent protease/predicted transcriptional regulator